MKNPYFKYILLIALLLTILYVNNRYEIFAVNIPKGEGIEKEKGSFRVMTWNVNGKYGVEEVTKTKNEIIEVVDRYNPDIVCFQELLPLTFKRIRSTLDSIFGYTDSMIIKKEPYRYKLYSRKPIRNFKQYKSVTEIDTMGLDQFQKDEIKNISRQTPVLSADIEMNPGQWITVFSCHLRSSAYSTARRSMEEGSSWYDGLPLYFENYKIGQKIRNWEADNFRLYLDSLESKDTPIIIAGDFNDWSGSDCMNIIRDCRYDDAWWKGGLGFGITYDEWHLKLRIDHILYNHHFKLKTVQVDNINYSDHYPLIADFELK